MATASVKRSRARAGSRSAPRRGVAYRIGWFIGRLIVWFLGLSVGFVLLYKFVPVPVTATMLMDPAGFSRDWVNLDAIDRNMVDAVIAGEDGKFCSHDGFDRQAIANAARRNLEGGRIRGGSTLSQQTAKNVFLWQGGGLFRKALEAWFTLLIEKVWGKRRIVEVYLNVAETGVGTYGAEAAAQRYYGKSARVLSRVEAARIAAALPQPKKRSVVAAKGFTRRHGNAIAGRTAVVRRDGLDTCVYR
jgi:monofunctional biosynthetic peptidoglycan transglycosylase